MCVCFRRIQRKESGPFVVDNGALKSIELFVDLAGWLLGRATADQMAVTRRLGFEKILKLLREDSRAADQTAADLLAAQMHEIMPRGTIALSLNPIDDREFGISSHYGIAPESAPGLAGLSQEGPVGQVILSKIQDDKP